MEIFKIENLTFKYPNCTQDTIKGIDLSVKKGEFITLAGKSGCGKTTLLRLLKPLISPAGERCGNIEFLGKALDSITSREQAERIGFVLQSPDNQIVTDKVWHELAFGLESLGFKTSEIRARVSEMAAFFGISDWFHKSVTELSGGQKQLLNLASVMVMQPDVLILDEPTSQLDPIAAQEFLNTIKKINNEIGTTVILSEHRLEDAFPLSHRVIILDEGKIICDASPKEAGRILKDNDMFFAFPTPMRIYSCVEKNFDFPLTAGEGRVWFEDFSKEHNIDKTKIPTYNENDGETVIELKDVWFRYEKNAPDIIKGMNLSVKKGELFCFLGGNGVGKTTALSIISANNRPHRGKVLINGEAIDKITDLYTKVLGVLPQNPESLFVKKTVYEDLLEMTSDDERIKEISTLCRIDGLLERHPYDLSGGEKQRVALAKVLLKKLEILLLDEPTKGMDASFKAVFADILENLKREGVTIVMVSHDIEFCAENADKCALVFDGDITSLAIPREFFAGKSFYTTAANRMARGIIPDAILPDDVILACGGKPLKTYEKKELGKEIEKQPEKIKQNKIKSNKIIFGILFFIMFMFTYKYGKGRFSDIAFQAITIIEMFLSLVCFLPKKEFDIKDVKKEKSGKQTLISAIVVLGLVPLTVFVGTAYFGGRKYYFISLLIILEVLIPFLLGFESKKPKARELVLISMLCAITVAGRMAFNMIPQFKPTLALIIISGVCFGGQTGFLVGAVSAFVSNFFFSQGPWTPWQMIASALVGFVSGILFKKGFLKREKVTLSAFGALATVIIYGGILNPASVIMYQENVNLEMILSAYILGFPYDVIHAISTVFFLWFTAEALIEKLERIKIKYGMIL